MQDSRAIHLKRATGLAAVVMLVASLASAGLPQTPAAPAAGAQAKKKPALLTRAERTNYTETSRYDDVMAFVKEVAASSPNLHVTTMGYTFEGRAIPLVVIGAKDATPGAVMATGKTRVYVEANIHAGEVEGKEAVLMLLRELAAGEHASWANSMVLMFGPIFNADGNERVNLTNRGRQNGPIGGMGQRPNGQNYDLNRDFVKLDSPETRSFADLYNRYDPHVYIDLHTTDGTLHGYEMTYIPALHPITPQPILDLSRNELLPAVTKAIKANYKWDFYYYGNVPTPPRPGGGGAPGAPGRAPGAAQAPPPREVGWYCDDILYAARYGFNYVGVRNRFTFESETFAYLPFEERIKVSRGFVVEVLNYVEKHGDAIKKAAADADKASIVGTDQAVRAKLVRSPQPVEILMADCVEERNPYTGALMWRRLDVKKPQTMPVFISYEASETAKAPRAYIVPGALTRVIDRLQGHGVKMTKVTKPLTLKVEQFRIESATTSATEYQGHKERTITGAWEAAEQTIPEGSFIVPMNQPLARVAFIVLEPRSDDAAAAWNLMDDVLDKSPIYPVTKTFSEVPIGSQ